MPISPAGKATDRTRAAGFTLIELLVVVSIMSILALGIGLTRGGVFARSSDTPRAVADRLSGAVQRARDMALLGRVSIGMHPRGDGWQVVERDAEGAWQSVGGLGQTVPVPLVWSVNGRGFSPRLAAPQPDDAPPVVFTPDGRGTAFSVTLGGLSCQSDGWGALTCG